MLKRDPMQGVEVVKKPTRKKPAMIPIDPDEIRRQVAPLAERLPSHAVAQKPALTGEVLPPELRTLDDYFAALSNEIAAAKKQYMRIGALLDRAEDALGLEGRAALVRRLSATHNVGASALSQMMTAYRAIVHGKVPAELEGSGYTTVYLLSDLSDEEKEQAKTEGLLQSGVRQAAVKEFVKRIRTLAPQKTERERIEAEIADLETKLKRARAKLAALVD